MCLFIDEIQYLKDDEFEALITAIHRVNQKGLPVTLFAIKNKNIDITSVQEAYPVFEKSLDDSFFKVRYDRAAPKEKEFMLAMVACGEVPCTIAQVANKMNTNMKSISPLRVILHFGF
ncbi:hypothetical protein [Pelosinus fermentans]|uniref:hypothetical protein n=1 Tax=Pelosinus fermentans TaxID=365349 RepID=UPI00031417DD|nr:hypothetical protein [Pelosinus fermentans]